MFRGNWDSHSVRSVWLEEAVNARFVRIHILEWHRHPSLRLEILGCQGSVIMREFTSLRIHPFQSRHNPYNIAMPCAKSQMILFLFRRARVHKFSVFLLLIFTIFLPSSFFSGGYDNNKGYDSHLEHIS